jgi:hypothetical protein
MLPALITSVVHMLSAVVRGCQCHWMTCGVTTVAVLVTIANWMCDVVRRRGF